MAKSKMKPADAVKVLATEVNQLKSVIQQMTQDLMQSRAFLNEVAQVLESYIVFEDNHLSFAEYMKKLGDEAAKENETNDNGSNESTDGSDTGEDKIDEGVGAEGVRA